MPRSAQDTPAGRGKEARPPSIEDVAAEADVSIATVSRLLNSPTLVAPATAARVQRAIDRLGYRPNRFAQGLMTRRSNVVGIVLPDIHGEFYSEILRGANAEALAHGYHLLVTSADRAGDGQTIGSGPFGLIDGLVVMATEPNAALWKEALATGLPVVALDTDPGEPGVASVLIDNGLGAREATRHLLQCTPPECCYFVGGPKGNFDTRQRADAFLAVLKSAGHRAQPDQTVFGSYAPEWGRTWASIVASRPRNRPIGILAGNDEIAFGVMDALRSAGWRVPEDARIVGFDDSRLASVVHPALSSVRVPRDNVGRAAIARLIEQIRDPERKTGPEYQLTSLVIRESSRPAEQA